MPERLKETPSSVADRLRKATEEAPRALRQKMEEALWELDKGLPPATSGEVLSRRVDF